MLKFLYELLINPLGLPIHPFWEWLILLFVGEITHEIAWWVSPGGEFGSLIYWATKLCAFMAIWAVLYGLIALIKAIIDYWPWFTFGAGILALGGVVAWIVLYKKKRFLSDATH